MKKWLLLTLFVVAAAGAALYIVQSPRGVSIGGVELGGGERAWLADRTVDFLEDIQFKDFKTASTYHLAKTQKERDIPEMIRSVFLVKHEVLDIQEYKILEVDLDRAKSRARVRALIHFRTLGDQTVRDRPDARRNTEMLFYWFRQPDGTWIMELESSLRGS
jgi:hypothetical protein